MAVPTSECVVLADGQVVSLEAILHTTSFDLYQTDLHYATCQTMARRHDADGATMKVLENILALKSRYLRTVSALTAYLRSADREVTSLCVSDTTRSLLDPAVLARLNVTRWRGREPRLLERRHAVLALAKAVLHRVFRWFGQLGPPVDTVVRGWVEVTVHMYPQESRSGQVLVYPFALNIARQLRFLRTCRAQGVRHSLAGMPYSVRAAIAAAFGGRSSALTLARFERDANARHADDLLARHPRHVLTSDEFEVASFVLHDRLRKEGVRVTNTAHGVGQYCLWISYSEFRVLSESQRDFYRARNPGISYELLETVLRPIDLPPYEDSMGRRPMVVLIHQPFADGPLTAEADAQRRLNLALEQLADELSIDYVVKMHPNHSPRKRRAPHDAIRGRKAYLWSELASARAIFVTINSTAFFDMRGIGPVLVYTAPTFAPALYFPRPFLTISLPSARASVAVLLDPQLWREAASMHAGDGKHPPSRQVLEALAC